MCWWSVCDWHGWLGLGAWVFGFGFVFGLILMWLFVWLVFVVVFACWLVGLIYGCDVTFNSVVI